MTDREIDTSDIPEISPRQFARAVVRRGLKPVPAKEQLTIRVDRDIARKLTMIATRRNITVSALVSPLAICCAVNRQRASRGDSPGRAGAFVT